MEVDRKVQKVWGDGSRLCETSGTFHATPNRQSIKFINRPTLSLFLGLELAPPHPPPPALFSSAVSAVGVFLARAELETALPTIPGNSLGLSWARRCGKLKDLLRWFLLHHFFLPLPEFVHSQLICPSEERLNQAMDISLSLSAAPVFLRHGQL